jgi:hypothetical protein
MEIKKHLGNIRDLDIEIREYFNPHDPEVKKGLEGIGLVLNFFLHLQQVERQEPAQTQLASNVIKPLLTEDAERPC